MPEPFTALTGVAAPLLLDNVDTDTIIPSREMRSTGRSGLKDGLFAPLRYSDVDGRVEEPTFVLNQPMYRDAPILLAGANFGCGSSREHAVWALHEYGMRAVVAESFAPIFAGNCVRNGIVPAALRRDEVEELVRRGEPVTVDLHDMTVSTPALACPFTLAEDDRQMLLHGLDAIDLTLQHKDDLSGWFEHDMAARPWVYA